MMKVDWWLKSIIIIIIIIKICKIDKIWKEYFYHIPNPVNVPGTLQTFEGKEFHLPKLLYFDYITKLSKHNSCTPFYLINS